MRQVVAPSLCRFGDVIWPHIRHRIASVKDLKIAFFVQASDARIVLENRMPARLPAVEYAALARVSLLSLARHAGR